MIKNIEQEFLNELDDKLWKAADRLRNNLDAANYKHVVLGIIFLKYVSDAFEERQHELRNLFTKETDQDNIFYMPRGDYSSDEEYANAINDELEIHDYYQEKNVFWVPKDARWSYLKSSAVLPMNTVLGQDDKGNDITLRSISWLIDNALESIESHKIDGKLANPKLKSILPRIDPTARECGFSKDSLSNMNKFYSVYKTRVPISETVFRKLNSNRLKNVKITLPKGTNIQAKEYQTFLPDKEELKAKLLEWADVECAGL